LFHPQSDTNAEWTTGFHVSKEPSTESFIKSQLFFALFDNFLFVKSLSS
jgi:hypothetical protein